MTRIEIEKNIVDFLEKNINDPNVKLIGKKFSGDHYAEFEFYKNDLRYQFSIVFIKPNFLKAICCLNISSKIITDILRTVNPNASYEFILCNINLNSFLVPIHQNGIYQTPDRIDFYIDEKPLNSIDDINNLTRNLFLNTVYDTIKNEIVPKTDSLEKLDFLFNFLPYQGNDDDKPNMTLYSSYLINQVLAGTLLAIATDRANKDELFKKYLRYSSKFQDGEHVSIDLMRKAIKRYG